MQNTSSQPPTPLSSGFAAMGMAIACEETLCRLRPQYRQVCQSLQTRLPHCGQFIATPSSPSKNLFSQGRERKLDGQVGGAVVLIDYGIDLDNLKADHASMVGDDLHGQVCFAIAGATAHGCPYTGSVFGVDPIHVERDVITGGAASGDAEGFFDNDPHATLVDIAHGVDFNPDVANGLALA